MRYVSLTALTVAAFLSPNVVAQESAGNSDSQESGQVPAQDGVTVYSPDDFSQFNPLTAWDLVQRIPGFSPETGGGPGQDDLRGFGGTAGNVLLDGERPSSKQGLRDILTRIPVSQVERIELIRGSVAGYDMRGQTEVVNIVRREGAIGSGSYLVHVKYNESQPVTVLGQASYAGRAGRWNYSANIFRDTDWRSDSGPEFLRDSDGNLIQRREESQEQYFRTWEGGFEADARFGRTDVRFNGQAQFALFNSREPSSRFDGNGDFDGYVLSLYDEDWTDYEFGGDIEHELTDQWSFKLIALNAGREFTATGEFDRFGSAGFEEAVVQTLQRETGETIARSFLTFTPNPKHSFEFGGERALNFLDSDVRLTIDNGTGPTEVDIPVSNTRVEETRNELFASWVWQARNNLTIEPGLIYEFSTIEQTGQGANSRDLSFWKPSVSASWQIDSRQQFSFTLERLVSQLDFQDFASSSEVNDNQVNLGNPNLEPDRTWNLEAAWQTGFWDNGALALTAKYEQIEELLDLIPVTTADNRRFDAPGNIGDAWRTQFGVEATLPLERFGVPGGLLDVRYTKQDSEVDDPVTGEPRKIRGDSDYWWGLDFRQDFTEQQISWGINARDRGPRSSFRLDEIRNNENTNPSVEVFVETTRFMGLTTRVQVENVLDRADRRERIFYDAPRDFGAIDQIETREKGGGLFFRFIVRGTF